MARVITFSKTFPKGHPKEGKGTYFLEKVQGSLYNLGYDLSMYIQNPKIHMENNWWDKSPKNHTIRAGNIWKAGDRFSPRIWTDKPYRSKMYQFAPDIEIKKIWDIEIKDGVFFIGNNLFTTNYGNLKIQELANNDGLSLSELLDWFKYPNDFKGQIICWNDKIEY